MNEQTDDRELLWTRRVPGQAQNRRVSMSASDRAAIRDTLQNGYGDAAQTILDDQIAGDVLVTLRERGWASLQEVGALILAAGGEIRLSERQRLLGDEIEVQAHRDPATLEMVYRARVTGS